MNPIAQRLINRIPNSDVRPTLVGQDLYGFQCVPAKGNGKPRYYSLRGVRCADAQAAAERTKAEGFPVY